jgi:hypothetical protein
MRPDRTGSYMNVTLMVTVPRGLPSCSQLGNDGRRFLLPLRGRRPEHQTGLKARQITCLGSAKMPSVAACLTESHPGRCCSLAVSLRVSVMPLSCGDSVQPAAEADECAGGAEDVPDAVQQPTPAAQRPRVRQLANRLLHQRAQPSLQAVERPLGVAEAVLGAAVPTGACQCSRVLVVPRNPRSSRLATSTPSNAPCSPASWMSSCSWQLPGQPPSHHSRSP